MCFVIVYIPSECSSWKMELPQVIHLVVFSQPSNLAGMSEP